MGTTSPVLTEVQRNFDLHQCQIVSTDAALSGDIMFFVTGFGEERTIPVGFSFEHRGERNDRHDVVGAQQMVPISRTRHGPAEGQARYRGASQLAVAAVLLSLRCFSASVPRHHHPAATSASREGQNKQNTALLSNHHRSIIASLLKHY